MKETVRVRSSDPAGLSLLGLLIVRVLEEKLADRGAVLTRNLSVTISLRVSTMEATVSFRGGEIWVENGASERADFHIQGDLASFYELLTRRRNPLRLFLTRRIRFKGNPTKALKLIRLFA